MEIVSCFCKTIHPQFKRFNRSSLKPASQKFLPEIRPRSSIPDVEKKLMFVILLGFASPKSVCLLCSMLSLGFLFYAKDCTLLPCLVADQMGKTIFPRFLLLRKFHIQTGSSAPASHFLIFF